MKRLLNNTKGFTLIEAIVTVAIVGIVVIPISNIFIGTLQKSMEAKTQLEANQIAQLYIENLKSRSIEDFQNLYSNDTVITNSDFVSDYYYGLPKLPNGYEVQLSYNNTELSAYDLNLPVSSIVYDYVFELEDDNIIISYYDTLTNTYVVDNSSCYYSQGFATTGNKVTVELNLDSTPSDIIEAEIKYQNSIGADLMSATKESKRQSSVANIQVICNADDSDYNDIEFLVTNDLAGKDIDIYIYRDNNSLVLPTITAIEGTVNTKYNLLATSGNDDPVVVIGVTVLKDSEVLATINSTKNYD